MSISLLGKKLGMTQCFHQDGHVIPITLVMVPTHFVTQIKTSDKDGYTALQLTAGTKRTRCIKKPQQGILKKAGVESGWKLFEFRCDQQICLKYKLGDAIEIGDCFIVGQKIDIRGLSKGKGFQGGVKRHHFKMQDATHGNSRSHRALGSTGQCQDPGRVFPGKKMAGQMGHVYRTVQNLEIVNIDNDKYLLMVKGAIPGAPGGLVRIMISVKTSSKESQS